MIPAIVANANKPSAAVINLRLIGNLPESDCEAGRQYFSLILRDPPYFQAVLCHGGKPPLLSRFVDFSPLG
jgi:hypothetical protein